MIIWRQSFSRLCLTLLVGAWTVLSLFLSNAEFSHAESHIGTSIESCQYRFSADAVNLWTSAGATHGNVVIATDIDDTLLASGGWYAGGVPLGGCDAKFPRGSSYPGLAALMFGFAIGPTASYRSKLQNEPKPILLVTVRLNNPLFRPSYLYQHANSILSEGARELSKNIKQEWTVGGENVMPINQAIRGRRGKVAGKVNFVSNMMNRRIQIPKVPVDDITRYVWFGDSFDFDLESGIALSIRDNKKLLATFLHLVSSSEPTNSVQPVEVPHKEVDEDIVKFAIEYNGRALEAIYLSYDVSLRVEVLGAQREMSCNDLKSSDAQAVSFLVGAKVRSILDAYSRKGKRSMESFNLSENVYNFLPPIFLKCNRVTLEEAQKKPDAKAQDLFQIVLNRLSHVTSDTVSVSFRNGDPSEEGFGTPIIPYFTPVSAAGIGHILGLLDFSQSVDILKSAIKGLRSKGPMGMHDWLPALQDHFYDVQTYISYFDGLNDQYEGYMKDVRDIRGDILRFIERGKSTELNRKLNECASEAAERMDESIFPKDLVSKFARFFCHYEIELGSLERAGVEEFEYITLVLGLLTEDAMRPVEGGAGSLDLLKLSNECVANKDIPAVALFKNFYNSLCNNMTSNICSILSSKLYSSEILNDMVMLAKWRASQSTEPLYLKNLDLVIDPPGSRSRSYESLHRQILPKWGEKAEKVIYTEKKYLYPVYDTTKSSHMWESVASAVSVAHSCRLYHQ